MINIAGVTLAYFLKITEKYTPASFAKILQDNILKLGYKHVMSLGLYLQAYKISKYIKFKHINSQKSTSNFYLE
jgi:hypothetical protein